jgi:hypothetical protein
MLNFQFVNKSYRPFLSKISSYKKLVKNFTESRIRIRIFFQGSDPDPHPNCQDPQHWFCQNSQFVDGVRLELCQYFMVFTV